MTDKEKIKKYDALAETQERIGGCFGSADKIFAGHPNDEKRAKTLRSVAKKGGVTLNEMQNILAGYLYRTRFPADHVKKQMKKASSFFGKKLE